MHLYTPAYIHLLYKHLPIYTPAVYAPAYIYARCKYTCLRIHCTHSRAHYGLAAHTQQGLAYTFLALYMHYIYIYRGIYASYIARHIHNTYIQRCIHTICSAIYIASVYAIHSRAQQRNLMTMTPLSRDTLEPDVRRCTVSVSASAAAEP
jgi:hypothetical protein